MIRSGFIFYSMIFCNVLLCRLRADDSCPSGENSDDSISKMVGFLDFVGNLLDEAKTFQRNDLSEIGDTEEGNLCEPLPMDCKEILLSGRNVSGVYKIWPRNRLPFVGVDVYCDMTTDGGGWTVFQRRGDFGSPSDYFSKDWNNYKEGFGNIEQDFWLGNDLLFGITNQRLYTLRVDMKNLRNESRFAIYDHFWINGEEHQYKLHVKGYSGTAGDALIFYYGRMFSTKDRDNDEDERGACALVFKGAWWYNKCHKSNLNGLYLKGSHRTFGKGVNWDPWRGSHYSLLFTEMKIRPFSNDI
uniref:U24-Liphistoxin-Lsp1a_1 n=1 Tax=Liphistius sp. SGP-2016 TaxID=1905180 RepID=A0A4Q8K602_9ARAC